MLHLYRSCAFVLSALFFVTGTAAAYAPTNQGGNINIVYIGAADGKSYFYDNTSMTWAEAQKYCKDSGMRLASVNTAGQINLWKQAFNEGTFDFHYWTAGRDAGSLKQFVWDHDDSSIDSGVVALSNAYLPGITWCLVYESNGASLFHSHLCEVNNVGVICEI